MNTTCVICDRVSWGQWVYLGHDKWRHAECVAGSKPWLEKMRQTPARTSEQEMLFTWYSTKEANRDEKEKETV